MDEATAALINESNQLLKTYSPKPSFIQLNSHKSSTLNGFKTRSKLRDESPVPDVQHDLEPRFHNKTEIQRDDIDTTKHKKPNSTKKKDLVPPRSSVCKDKPKKKGVLGNREWENELARNILSLYHATEPENQTAKSPKKKKDNLPPLKISTAKKLPRHIWFAGTGAVRTIWCALSIEAIEGSGPVSKQLDPVLCSHRVCIEFRNLEANQKFDEYLDRISDLLQGYSRRVVNKRCERRQLARLMSTCPPKQRLHHETCGHEISIEGDEIHGEFTECDDNGIDYEALDPTVLGMDDEGRAEIMMWRQFVVCCYTFGVKLTEQGQFETGLALLKRAENIIESGSAIEGGNAFVGRIKNQFQGYIDDSLAFYYLRRSKLNAAALYAQRSMRMHFKMKQWSHVAKCHLHCATILSRMSKHEESIKCLAQVLEMVEDERLQIGGTNAEKICLVAVCYHNIAVEQIILSRAAEASVSSQNARRLARLSLSYANRWINNFEATHQYALKDLSERHSYMFKAKGKKTNTVVRENLTNPKVKTLYKKIASNLG